jgi:hypothetical protein
VKKKIDSVQLQRAIRAKLSEKYAKARQTELDDLRAKFSHLRKQKTAGG